MQLYFEMASPSRFGGAPKGRAVLQSNIKCTESNAGKFIVAVYPQSDSTSWHFLSPDGQVWINGIDGVAAAEECILMFDCLDGAGKALDRQMAGFPNSTRWAVFKSLIDDGGDLQLLSHKEYERAEA